MADHSEISVEGHVKVQLRHRRGVKLSILGGAFCPQVDFFVLLIYRLSKQICKVVLMNFPDVRGMSQGTTLPSADSTHSCFYFGGYEATLMFWSIQTFHQGHMKKYVFTQRVIGGAGSAVRPAWARFVRDGGSAKWDNARFSADPNPQRSSGWAYCADHRSLCMARKSVGMR